MLPEVIDFHSHPLYDFHNFEHGVPLTLERYRDDLLQAGTSMACGSVIYLEMNCRPVEEYAQIIPLLNDQALHARDVLGNFYVPGIHVHPAHVRLSCEELQRCRAKGVKLVGELVHYMMGWKDYSCPEMLEILEYADQLDMVVNIHPSNVADMEKLAAALPHLRLVIAHLSGYGQYEGHIELMRRHENVYFDYSAHGPDNDGLLRRTIDLVGSERILYGTDYPGTGPSSTLAALMFEDLTDSEREALLSLNARRLLFSDR